MKLLHSKTSFVYMKHMNKAQCMTKAICHKDLTANSSIIQVS